MAAASTCLSGGRLHAQPEESRYSIMLGGSYTGAGDLELSGDTLGEVETTRFRLEAGYAIPSGPDWMFRIGGEFDLLEIDHSPGGSLLPDRLAAMALNLRAMWRLDDRWALSASLSPGFYGDDEVDFSDALNAPLMLLAHWQRTENVSVSAGLRVDAFSDMPVIPVLGIGWKINPEWELMLGLPRTELRHQRSRQLAVYAGVAMEGGSYAVDDPSLVTPRGKSLRDTYLSVSEFRGLVGLEYKFGSGMKIGVEGGYAFERSFDYHEKNVELEVDPGAFGAVSVSFEF